MTEDTKTSVPPDISHQESWSSAKKGLTIMFWASFASIALNATSLSNRTGVTIITHHTILSRSLLLLTMLISGYAYYTIPQRNRNAWKWGALLPWLFYSGIAITGLAGTPITEIGWPLATSLGLCFLLVCLFTRSWRRSWREIESMVTEQKTTQPPSHDRAY
jgi:hypothetical protein